MRKQPQAENNEHWQGLVPHQAQLGQGLAALMLATATLALASNGRAMMAGGVGVVGSRQCALSTCNH